MDELPTNFLIASISNFIYTFGAVQFLLAHARIKQAWLEVVVLSATMTDGLLRTSLLLKKQLDTSSRTWDPGLFQQQEDGEFLSERAVIRLAKGMGAIDESIRERLESLYGRRNHAIHRFFLTEIKYSDLQGIAREYEELIEELIGVVYEWEETHVRLGTGVVSGDGGDVANDEQFAGMMEKIRQKIGDSRVEFRARVNECTS